MKFITNFIKEEDGVTAIEYALIAALIAGAIALSVTTLGGKIQGIFKSLGDMISSKTGV